MPLPFTSWQSLSHPSELFKGAEVQINGYRLQFVRFTRKQLYTGPPITVICSWLFFQYLENEDDAGFVLTDGDPFLKQLPNAWYFHEDALEAQQSYRLETALKKGDLARLFFLDNQDNLYKGEGLARLALLVGAGGWGQWIQLSASLEDLPLFQRSTVFVWNDSPNINQFLTVPASKQWEIIAEQKADASSDCAFARRALDWSRQERNALLYGWKKGSRTELETVLRAALIGQRDLWTNSAGCEWVIRVDRFHGADYWGDWNDLDAPRSTGSNPPNEVRAILRRVAPFFEVVFNRELTTPHREALRWGYYFHERVVVRVENPTAHEQLEAALFWSEWQATHPLID